VASLRPVSGTAAEVLALLRDWDATDDPEPLVVETSGSTGRPKRVVLSRTAMRASADATHARLGGPGQWLLALPPTYVAGLQVLFRSVRAGTEPVDRVDELTGDRCYVSLVPTQLHRMVEDASLRRFDTVLVGGAALDPALRQRAERAGVRVVTTYGMSETCGGCVYDGRPLDGVRVDVVDGVVRVGGPVLFDGYEDDAASTAQVLVDGWFHTSDRGRVDADGLLHLEGRTDDVVVSGGVNVATDAVARRLRTHPRVEAAEVVGVPDAEWGRRVVAVVVGDVDTGTARDWVSAEHPRTWAPRDVKRVDALPLLPNGKVDRRAVERLARG
jgi:O-succinylbenzoic acid--CoA ligase